MSLKRLAPVVAIVLVGLVLFLVFRSGDEPADRSSAQPTGERSSAAEVVQAEALLPAGDVPEEAASPSPRVALPSASGAPAHAAPAETQVAGGPVIRGRVLASGRGLSGAEVVATRAQHLFGPLDRPAPRGFTAVTGADGSFEILGMKPGNFDLAVRFEGYAPLDRKGLNLPEVDAYDVGDLPLTLGAILEGRVVDADGRGVEGASLSLSNNEDGLIMLGGRTDALAVTKPDGSFRVPYLACGPWRMLVTSDVHPAGIFRGEANTPGGTVQGLLFQLRPAATIAGRVLDIDPAEAHELRVRVSPAGGLDLLSTGGDPDAHDRMAEEFAVGRREAMVAEDGRFEVFGLTAGHKYRLEAARGSRPGAFVFGGPSASGTVIATAGDRGVELRYEPLGAILLQVVDASTRKPVEDFVVRTGGRFGRTPLRGEDGKTLKHHPDGVARIDGLATGDRTTTLGIQATGFADYDSEDIRLQAGEELDLGQIALDPMALVKVRVIEQATGRPVEGARVSLARQTANASNDYELSIEIEQDDELPVFGGDQQRRGVTDSEGWVTLTSFEGERVTLEVDSKNHAHLEVRDWDLPRGESVEREVGLLKGGRVLVTVLDPDGVPLPGARVRRRAPGAQAQGMVFTEVFDLAGGSGRTVTTDGDGVAIFEHLEPGLHGFKLGSESEPGVITLEGGEGAFVSSNVRVAGGGLDDLPSQGSPWSEVEVVDGDTHELELYADAVGGLAGRVREGGVPLAGALLSLASQQESSGRPGLPGMFGGGPRAKSDGDGRYSFEEVKAGRYELTVTHASRAMPARFEVEVEDGRTSFDVELSVSILSGRITDPGGKPLAGVKVEAEEVVEDAGPQVRMMSVMILDDGSAGGGGAVTMSSGNEAKPTYTDVAGYYSLRGVPSEVPLVVRATGSAVQTGTSEPVTVGADEERGGVNLSLQPAGELEVEVVNAKGEPVRLCLVTASPIEVDAKAELSRGDYPRSMTNPEGIATLGGMAAGLWELDAQTFGDTQGRVEPLQVEVEPGKTERVTLIVR